MLLYCINPSKLAGCFRLIPDPKQLSCCAVLCCSLPFSKSCKANYCNLSLLKVMNKVPDKHQSISPCSLAVSISHMNLTATDQLIHFLTWHWVYSLRSRVLKLRDVFTPLRIWHSLHDAGCQAQTDRRKLAVEPSNRGHLPRPRDSLWLRRWVYLSTTVNWTDWWGK